MNSPGISRAEGPTALRAVPSASPCIIYTPQDTAEMQLQPEFGECLTQCPSVAPSLRLSGASVLRTNVSSGLQPNGCVVSCIWGGVYNAWRGTRERPAGLGDPRSLELGSSIEVSLCVVTVVLGDLGLVL